MAVYYLFNLLNLISILIDVSWRVSCIGEHHTRPTHRRPVSDVFQLMGFDSIFTLGCSRDTILRGTNGVGLPDVELTKKTLDENRGILCTGFTAANRISCSCFSYC